MTEMRKIVFPELIIWHIYCLNFYFCVKIKQQIKKSAFLTNLTELVNQAYLFLIRI